EQVWSTLWNQGAFATLFHWMQTLPEDVLPHSPNLFVAYAWGLALTGQIEAAEASLQRIETTLQQTAMEAAVPPHPIRLGHAAALRAMLAARRGEPVDAVHLAQQALTLIPVDAAQRGDAYYALGLAKQQQGVLAEAYQAYEAAAKLGTVRNDHFLTVAARYHTARIFMVQGQLRQAATTYQQILAVAAQAKQQLPVVGLAHIGYAEILYQWNDLAAAVQQVETGLALSPRRDPTYTDGPLHRFSILARIRQALGDETGALAAVASAKEMAQQTGIALDVERAEALEALILLHLGDWPTVTAWAERYTARQTTETRFTYLHEFETLVFARILLAQGHVTELLTLLTQWLAAITAEPRQGTIIEMQMLQVLALRVAGQRTSAAQLLTHVLTVAEAQGYIRLFVDEGEAMRMAITDGSATIRDWTLRSATTLPNCWRHFPKSTRRQSRLCAR
ncbi:MAG: hypothetical protein R2867_47160, partial [Caldilineaceae bacterium]